ncbi:MAG: acetyl-CoA carboxylase carboxyltransferase subunit alpha [Proteobacteria bacterium]|nr:acetyl-CoA carboxylase carboxyltransferase subunit alpha [Pseudomonadota bacterium]MDA1323657.1 acetyl-CoA carboxylase carboxyltransferase subunit alpha [Pseudomonadota bacterium]
MQSFLGFEKSIAELEGKMEELRHLNDIGDIKIADEVSTLRDRIERTLQQTYSKLSSWQKVQVARHPNRPHCVDYIEGLVDDFTPLAGDRAFSEDAAIMGGLGRFRGRSVVVIGQEKGNDTETRVKHNFGMARPEGYRKAIRLMDLAQRFNIPIVTFVDTPGAYPGLGAEERGQAEAIARSIEKCLGLTVPIVSVVIGEGGSGGAIAIAAANRVLMMEYAIYSVISPEGCASILWRSADHAEEAAEALKMTAEDLLAFGVIDSIIPEPLGAAHRGAPEAIRAVGDAVEENLRELDGQDGAVLRSHRRERFLTLGNDALTA